MRLPRGILVFSIGFFALAAQTLLIRDYITAFEGNEAGIAVFFASWFLWIVMGAAAGRHLRLSGEHFPALALLYLPAFVFEHYLLLGSRDLLGIAAYEVFPFGPMAVLSFAANAPVSLLTGLLFPQACAWAAEGDRALTPALVYAFETLGAAAAGFCVTFCLAGEWPAPSIFLAAASVLACGVAIAWPAWTLRFVPAGLALTALASGQGKDIAEREALAAWTRLLPAESYKDGFATLQATYQYGRRKGQFVVTSMGSICESLPNEEYAGSVLATVLSQHPEARDILVAGPNTLAICGAFARLPQTNRVHWLHPDPLYPKFLHPQCPPDLDPDSKIVSHYANLRYYLMAHEERFDLFVINMPKPATLVQNRFFSEEFYRLAKSRLRIDGVLAVRTTGAANYLGSELGYLGASVLATLDAVFEHTALRPGDESWILASDADGLTEAPGELRDRFAAIPGAESIYPPDGIYSLYLSDRIVFQRSVYAEALQQAGPEVLINRDERPFSLLYTLLVSMRQAGWGGLADYAAGLIRRGWILALLVCVVYAVLRLIYLVRQPGSRDPGPFDGLALVFSAGMAGMATSILLLFRFQAHFGMLYLFVGLLSALFMVGAFLSGVAGAYALGRIEREPGWLIPAVLIAHAALLLALTYETVTPYGSMLAFAATGLVTGAYFPVAALRLRLAGHPPGAAGSVLEISDHLGAAVGAAITGVFLLPLFGTTTTLFLLAVLMAANAPPLILKRTAQPRGDRRDRVARRLGYVAAGVAMVLIFGSNQMAAWARGPLWEDLARKARTYASEKTPLPEEAQLESGEMLRYFTLSEEEEAASDIFDTSLLAPNTMGYAGPIVLSAHVGRDGVLHAVDILASRETPAYLRFIQSWMDGFPGLNLFEGDGLESVDAVSGATLTTRAVLDALGQAPREFARQVLGRDIEQRMQAAPPLHDSHFWWLAGFLSLAVVLRFRPHQWIRHGFLLAVFLTLGLWLNLQFSTHHLIALLSLEWPRLALNGAVFMTIAVPLATLLVGNVYCGWICPFGAVQELIGETRPANVATDPDKAVWRYARYVKYGLLFLLVVLFAWTRNYEVLGADPLITLFAAARSRFVLLLTMAVLVLCFFYRRFWCRNLCPAGAFLAILAAIRPLRFFNPAIFPRRCDLGVRNRRELDCIRCDRCRHE